MLEIDQLSFRQGKKQDCDQLMHDNGVMVIRLLHVMAQSIPNFMYSGDVDEYIDVFAISGKFNEVAEGFYPMGACEYHARGVLIKIGNADNLDEIC